MSDWNEPGPGYSAFPAVVVFFAIVLVSCALVFRGHLFEGPAQVRVFVPVEHASLEKDDSDEGCNVASVCSAPVPR